MKRRRDPLRRRRPVRRLSGVNGLVTIVSGLIRRRLHLQILS
jgi:hypothetical protein